MHAAIVSNQRRPTNGELPENIEVTVVVFAISFCIVNGFVPIWVVVSIGVTIVADISVWL